MTRGKKKQHSGPFSKAADTFIDSSNPNDMDEANGVSKVADDTKQTSLSELVPDVDNNPSQKDTSENIVDILGNSLLIKKINAKGLGRETRPERGDTVTIRFKAFLEDGTEVESTDNLTCVVGDGDVVQALDLALPFAEVNEKFTLTVDSRFAFGARGRHPDVPSNANLRYEVEVLSVSEPPSYSQMDVTERVAAADIKRERGNYYYRREEYAFAVNSYNKALSILHPPRDTVESWEIGQDLDGTNDSEILENLEVKLYNNLAATQLKIQAYEAAIKSCNSVLFKHPHNYKALFRKGQALLEQGDVDEAIPILRNVRGMVPTSALVEGELRRALAIQRKERERWSRAANRMFPRQAVSRNENSSLTSRICSIWHAHRLLVSTALLFAIISFIFIWFRQSLQLSPFDRVLRFFAPLYQ